jgi:5-methylcytosine-specific restriction endonuclease McrA
MLNIPVLVLNQNYEPLNVCLARRALVLLYQSKAEMLEDGVGFVRGASGLYPVPSVIRLPYLVKRPFRAGRRLTRFEVFNRDRYECQYCGKTTRQLTLDHVLPRYRGGPHTWENLVSACTPCNRRKAGKTPDEAGMKLRNRPTTPRAGRYSYIPAQHLQAREEWRRYLPQ